MIEKFPAQLSSQDIPRTLLKEALKQLDFAPAVALLGPRQVGKTTMAKAISAHFPGAVHLDLQLPEDRQRLSGASAFLQSHRDRLVVLDEVQYVPEIFAQLRPEIDAHRTSGRFLLLGSASGKLLRQSSESLAGRVSYLELTPIQISELQLVNSDAESLMHKLWLRGGFPLSFLAPSEVSSFDWRLSFISTFLNRDLREFGVNVPAQTLHRFWRMSAHLHGQLFNASSMALALGGISHATVGRYLDSLVDTMMLRRLEPHFANVGKRLTKSPKLYVRDTGLLHALLNLNGMDSLSGHPIIGRSWEGLMIEQIFALAPKGADLGFYRTAAGAELDLVVDTGSKKIGFEIKFSKTPTLTKGFWQACKDTEVAHAYVLAPVTQGWSIKSHQDHTVDVISPFQLSDVMSQCRY